MDGVIVTGQGHSKDEIKAEIDKALHSGSAPRILRFILGCLGGLPVAGGLVSATGSAWSEADQGKFNQFLVAWLKMQEKDVEDIGKTMTEVAARLNLHDAQIEDRIRSAEYLTLVRKCFRDWAGSESEQKRTFIRNLLINAASSSLCSDDVIRMFIDWIDRYTEAHFKVIQAVYQHPSSSRGDIWALIDGKDVREDSADADLFKLLIHELTVGRVIRQHREKDYQGNYLKVNPQRTRRPASRTMVSAFDDGKEYELTELGAQFVHYTMNELVPKLGYQEPSPPQNTA